MIRVKEVSIKEFRGIRELTLPLDGKNFAVCGPNGTGKSGIVDALEFAITGNISRLSGEGRGEVSVKEHAPHVDSRKHPEKASVTLVLELPGLGKQVTLERSVKFPRAPKITPDDPDVRLVLATAELHPEIVLSRRELIKYVLATPGQRAQEVQSLLHLDQVETLRGVLLKLANATEREHKQALEIEAQAKVRVAAALGQPDFSEEKLLSESNARRGALGLPELTALTPTTTLNDGIGGETPATTPRVSKKQALADIATLKAVSEEGAATALRDLVGAASAAVTALREDPHVAAGVARQGFYSAGLALFDGEACPFCDTSWKPELLRAHVARKQQELEEVARRRRETETLLGPLLATIAKADAAITDVLVHAGRLPTPVALPESRASQTALLAAKTALTEFVPLDRTQACVDQLPDLLLRSGKELSALLAAVDALPEPTGEQDARVWLAIAQERLDGLRSASAALAQAAIHSKRARALSDLYAATSDKVLTGIYAQVQDDFARLYAAINAEDESKFQAKLTPSLGKLGFDVDFYGRGHFPPGAYHSEGHQDGMGLCLYLALMRYLQGANFTFAVLDDVLMSVDAAHRRQVCAILKQEFSATQFVLTTHDPTWLRHMRTEGLIASRSAAHFHKWDVESGPAQWDDRDVWKEIDDYLDKNDVRGAASLLRHFLEYQSAELCHRLRARVEFRGDAQYQLGELLPAAVGRLRALYKEAKSAANSWNQKDKVADLAARETALATLVQRSNVEQWQVNVAVHFNEWENLNKPDFLPVVAAYRDLLGAFFCVSCNSYLRVTPERETRELVNCDCKQLSYNLLERP